eukprot:2831626-Amphidinium_carterae.1
MSHWQRCVGTNHQSGACSILYYLRAPCAHVCEVSYLGWSSESFPDVNDCHTCWAKTLNCRVNWKRKKVVIKHNHSFRTLDAVCRAPIVLGDAHPIHVRLGCHHTIAKLTSQKFVLVAASVP